MRREHLRIIDEKVSVNWDLRNGSWNAGWGGYLATTLITHDLELKSYQSNDEQWKLNENRVCYIESIDLSEKSTTPEKHAANVISHFKHSGSDHHENRIEDHIVATVRAGPSYLRSTFRISKFLKEMEKYVSDGNSLHYKVSSASCVLLTQKWL